MADTRVDPKTGLTFAQASAKGVGWTAPKDPQGFAILTSPTTTPAVTTAPKTTAPVTTGVDWAAYYRGVLANPTALESSKAEARQQLGITSASDLVAGLVSPQFPEDTTAVDANAAISTATGTEALIKSLNEQMAKMNAQSEKLAAQQEAALTGLTTYQPTSQTELLQQQYGQWAVPETVSQIKGITQSTLPLYQQIATLTNAETAEIERVSQMGMSEGWKETKTISTQNKYNKLKAPIAVQLNAYAAQINALQGNLSIAQGFISAAVNAATYDQEFEYNRMRDFIDINQTFINNLTSQQQFTFSNSLDLLKWELDNAREDKTNIGNLIIENPSAGITFNDTLDVATAKASKFQATIGTGLTETIVGGFRVLKDAAGNIISTGTVSAGEGGEIDTRQYIQDPNNPSASIPNPNYGKTIIGVGAGATITPDQLSPLAYSVYVGTIKLSDITPTQKAQIAPELTAVGYTSSLDFEMKQAVSYIKNQMPEVLAKWEAIPSSLKGLFQGWITEKLGGGLWSKEIAEFNAAAKIVGMQLTRLYEKGRISDQDRIFYLSIMPNIRMNEEAAKAGADELIRLLEEKLTNQVNELETGTINPGSTDVDYLKGLGY